MWRVGIVATVAMLPETSGHSLEELSARNSPIVHMLDRAEAEVSAPGSR